MIQIPKIDIYPYWELVKRRKWWLIIPFVFVVMLGSGYIVTAPKVYRASTLILVESQRVPSRYVKPAISQDLRSRLHTITQQIKSRSYLKKVINRYDLAKRESSLEDIGVLDRVLQYAQRIPFISDGSTSKAQEKEKKSTYAMVKMLRKKIEVTLQGRRNSAFEVAFEWREPEIAAEVANALASQFIEQNLNLRSEMAMGTTDFLSLQVHQLRNQLQKSEKKLENYRNEHLGSLPSQRESNFNMLNHLKDEKNKLEERLEMRRNRARLIRDQIQLNSIPSRSQNVYEKSQSENKIGHLKDKLESLKSKYTKNHPDVIALKDRIQDLRKHTADQNTEKANNTSNSVNDKFNDQVNIPAQIATNTAQPQIEKLKNKIEELNKRIKKYRQRIEKTPKVKMKLKDLQRDYDAVKGRYDSLFSKKLDAEMAEELEKRQKGEQFKVIDSAIPPKTPFKPDVRKLGLMTLLLGLGIGGGLSYLRESLDPAFYTANDAENQLGRKVLVSLPWEDSKE